VIEAVQSLTGQDYPDDRYEVLVIDDGSNDGTARAVRHLSKDSGKPRIHLIRQSPRNQNAARNRGIREGTGSRIVFFDDDEIAPVGWLTALVGAALRFPEAACVGGPYRVRFEGRQPRICSRCWPGEAGFDLGANERYVDDVAGGNMIVKRYAFDAIGGFDESLQGRRDETEWMLRVAAAGQLVAYVPGAWVWHRRTPDQLRLTARGAKAFAMGQQEARYLGRIGRQPALVDVTRRLARTPRLLGHAVRQQCSEGLMHAIAAVGFTTQIVRSCRAVRSPLSLGNDVIAIGRHAGHWSRRRYDWSLLWATEHLGRLWGRLRQ
jgi:cellulose synthase/poly-beta-1,6-N-acetylglucosamine synthase-like glycosyltransferase